MVSLGAALDANTGLVLDSGPLWGGRAEPLDLEAALHDRAPAWRWRVLNDVTAALLRHVAALPQRRRGRMALITISSGIACRVYDFARRCVPVDAGHGLQGEIGHLPVACTVGGQRLALTCACGGLDHLNAYASGLGLQAVLARIAPDAPLDTEPHRGPTLEQLLARGRAGDPWCRGVLEQVFQPLAEILRVMLTHDPELDPIVFVGGVTAALGDALIDILCRHLERVGLYQITTREPAYFRGRLRLGFLDDDSGLLGCGLAEDMLPRVPTGQSAAPGRRHGDT